MRIESRESAFNPHTLLIAREAGVWAGGGGAMKLALWRLYLTVVLH
jgi:hypothetical protein